MPPTVVRLTPRSTALLNAVVVLGLAVVLAWTATNQDGLGSTALMLVFAAGPAGLGLLSLRSLRDRLVIGVDAVTVHHVSLRRPLTMPRATIVAAIAGPADEVGRPTTIPPGRPDSRRANLVLELAAPITVRGILARRERSIDAVALVAADPAQAAAAISLLGLREPSLYVADERPARKRPGRRAAAIQTIVTIAVGGGLAWAKIQADPPPASAANDYARAEKTEGRSRLPDVPSIDGAIAFRARAADGSLLYAWQTGGQLRVRVDISPYDCSGANWREWWETAEHLMVKIEADGSFFDVRRHTGPVAAGGIDILTSWVEGHVHGGHLDVRFTRKDDYRSAVGDGICQRAESFSARRSG
jgi:hypothetical protein